MLQLIHGRLALTILLYTFAMGAWAALIFFRNRGIESSYWGALVIGEVVMLAQGVLGLVMVIVGLHPADILHFLYGVLVAFSWPGTYIYTHARQGRAEAGIYSIVSFFIFGLAIRALMTGG
jgi:heme A synthase